MLIKNTFKLLGLELKKLFFPRLGFFICIICFFRNFPWNDHDLIYLFNQGYDSFSSSGLIAGFLLIIYPIVDLHQSENTLLHLKSRYNITFHCTIQISIIAVIVSLYYVIVTFSAITTYSGNISGWQNTSVKLLNDSLYILAFRTIIILAIFLSICGIIYTFLVRLSNNKALAFMITVSVVLIDLGQTLYSNKSLLYRFVYPNAIHLHTEDIFFHTSVIYLLLIAIILIILLTLVTERKDFLSPKNERNTI